MPSSKIGHTIKNRESPKDVFLTPEPLAIRHIEIVSKIYEENKYDGIWLDPCKGTGNYYNNFPDIEKDWCEIADNKDFYKYDKNISTIIGNPPYSHLKTFIQKIIELKPDIISLLLSNLSVTHRKLSDMEQAGYIVTNLEVCKVFSWYSESNIITWEKKTRPEQVSILQFNMTIYRTPEDEKSRKEKSKNNKRKCGICKKIGHDRRKCPEK